MFVAVAAIRARAVLGVFSSMHEIPSATDEYSACPHLPERQPCRAHTALRQETRGAVRQGIVLVPVSGSARPVLPGRAHGYRAPESHGRAGGAGARDRRHVRRRAQNTRSPCKFAARDVHVPKEPGHADAQQPSRAGDTRRAGQREARPAAAEKPRRNAAHVCPFDGVPHGLEPRHPAVYRRADGRARSPLGHLCSRKRPRAASWRAGPATPVLLRRGLNMHPPAAKARCKQGPFSGRSWDDPPPGGGPGLRLAAQRRRAQPSRSGLGTAAKPTRGRAPPPRQGRNMPCPGGGAWTRHSRT